jgi:hypothetical protein
MYNIFFCGIYLISDFVLKRNIRYCIKERKSKSR